MCQYTVLDLVNICRSKLQFINETFAQAKPEEHFSLSAEAMSGFYYFVEGIDDDLGDVYNRLAQPEEK